MIKVQQIPKSKIESVDFDNLVFGKTFTDHMFICHYKDSKWQKPEIKPYQPLTLDPSASVLHYGQAVFEGMKAFKDHKEKIWLLTSEEKIVWIIGMRTDNRFKDQNQSKNILKITTLQN